MIFRRDRFGDLVRRQLDVFAEDESELLREAEEAEGAYDAAEREEAEELYGDYQLVLEAVAEGLTALRDAYTATLDDAAAEEYVASFERAAGKRHPRVRL